jgi:alpha-glucosidase
VGVPCIYYGDEIGMSGKDSLAARDPMIWDSARWDGDLRSFHQALVHLRRSSRALIDGGFQILLCEENLLAFLRDTDEEQVIVIGNRGPAECPAQPLFVKNGGIPDGTAFREILTGQTLTVQEGTLSLPPIPPGVQVWRSIH